MNESLSKGKRVMYTDASLPKLWMRTAIGVTGRDELVTCASDIARSPEEAEEIAVAAALTQPTKTWTPKKRIGTSAKGGCPIRQ